MRPVSTPPPSEWPPMNEPLDLFSEPESERMPAAAAPMSELQRSDIRALFTSLGTSTASEQFAVVDELIGVRLTSVAGLTATDASRLVQRLRARVQSQSRTSTGNSWADRDEDTWIDRL